MVLVMVPLLNFLPKSSRDSLVVRTLRCGVAQQSRSNPGSNPGHGIANARLSRIVL